MPEGPKEFAVSSNGDKWFLEHDGAAGEHIVIHRANIASGGTETRWSISSFLEVAADHLKGKLFAKLCATFVLWKGNQGAKARLVSRNR